jgi:membrane-bound lytic murein transglycosylase B
MINTTHKRLAQLVLIILLVSCSSKPVYRKTYPQGTTSTAPVTVPVISTPQISAIGSYSAPTLTGTYANSYALQSFIQKMVSQYGFSQSYLNGLFSRSNHLESVVQLEEPIQRISFTTPSSGAWSNYRQKFLDEAHITNGIKFWRENAATLQKATSTYHVDPEYIVAIIGVETYFGRNVGKTNTMDALTTLAFDTQRRATFFTSELENFLLMAREEGYDPRQIVSSWAGAMGIGQFMPSSFRKLAVDFNNDGKRDLWNSTDAIGSVANYFTRSGWQLNGAVAQQTSASSFDLNVIQLSTYSGTEFWSVSPNFKVIKKYNSSDHYAMAVHQLAQAIKQRY